jgi:hypothetical protein
MTSCNRAWTAMFVTAMCGLSVACSSSGNTGSSGNAGSSGSTGSSGNTGSGGSTSGGAGMPAGDGGAPLCINTEMDNQNCPAVPPFKGPCTARGACCHRSSNSAKEAALGPNDPLTLEYRLNYSFTVNHPMTIGMPLVASMTESVYDTEQQSDLIRIVSPRKDGQEISGPGKFTFRVGRYNCDGTYSYYSNTAAPVVSGVSSDPARWALQEADMDVDVSKMGVDRYKIPFSKSTSRGLSYTPYLNLNSAAHELDWELIDEGFKLVQFDPSGAGRDCMGSRDGSWTAGGKFEIYTPLAGNNKQIIATIQQTYCALVAFSILSTAQKSLNCETEPRCMPGSASCPWMKLPDALCPKDKGEQDLFGCHLGAEGNVNGETGYPADLHCSPTPPTTAQDPDKGVTTVGQCCDPLGKSTTLPACNAYRVINEFVAAASEITDDLKSQVQQGCI